MHLKNIFVFIAIIILYNSCTFFDNDSYNPTYLILKDPKLTTKTGQGDPVHDIKDVWVYVNGNFIGIFPLPAKVPVLATNSNMEILIAAGVKENADLNSSSEYPFFTRVETTVLAEEGKEITIPLNFSYRDDLKFDIVEGFENSFQVFTKDVDGNSETRVNLSNEDKVSGLRSGLIVLNNTNIDFETTTENYFSNNQNAGGSVFLEFDYKCDENLLVGADVISNALQIAEYKIILVKSDEWKRAYINFTDEISTPNVQNYRVIFGAGYESNTGIDSKLFIDNVKLIHF